MQSSLYLSQTTFQTGNATVLVKFIPLFSFPRPAFYMTADRQSVKKTETRICNLVVYKKLVSVQDRFLPHAANVLSPH